jgi:hypothetical protein
MYFHCFMNFKTHGKLGLHPWIECRQIPYNFINKFRGCLETFYPCRIKCLQHEVDCISHVLKWDSVDLYFNILIFRSWFFNTQIVSILSPAQVSTDKAWVPEVVTCYTTALQRFIIRTNSWWVAEYSGLKEMPPCTFQAYWLHIVYRTFTSSFVTGISVCMQILSCKGARECAFKFRHLVCISVLISIE